jgi:C4-dicarboxylate transporter DctQ subunit
MPVSSAVAILAIIDSLRTRRDLIALPEPGLPPGELAYADVNMTAGAQP